MSDFARDRGIVSNELESLINSIQLKERLYDQARARKISIFILFNSKRFL